VCAIDPRLARRTHVELFARMMEGAGLASASVKRRLATMSSFYRWLVAEEILLHNPVANVRRPKVSDESVLIGLGRAELADWLNHAEQRGGYDYALACLLALNGLRIGEVTATDVTDLGENRWHHTLAITGKGAQPAVVPLAPRTKLAIEEALQGRADGPLLLNRWGNRLTRANADKTVKRLAAAAGIDKRLSPHSLRHSAITAAHMRGVASGASFRGGCDPCGCGVGRSRAAGLAC
jgi:site-specific recombinase XerC